MSARTRLTGAAKLGNSAPRMAVMAQKSRRYASGLGFNWSMQQFKFYMNIRTIADEVLDLDLLSRQSEGSDVGSIEEG